MDILKKLQTLHQNNRTKAKVYWYYEEDDEDILEAGDDYQAIIRVPFEIDSTLIVLLISLTIFLGLEIIQLNPLNTIK